MTYNAANLFDDIDNGTEYPEFDPGNGKWTTEKFNTKLEKTAEVIRYINPDIAALQEIENENALNKLCDTHLSGYDYRVLYPVKGSSVNCAIISKIKIEYVNAIVPDSSNNYRAILEICVNVNEYEENNRIYITALIPSSYIDDAETVTSICITSEINNSSGTDVPVILYDPWFEYNLDETGSYFYKGNWQTPDHILLSPGLFNENGFLYSTGNFNIINEPFLIDPETGLPIKENFSEYIYSDHLPLTVRISYNNQ